MHDPPPDDLNAWDLVGTYISTDAITLSVSYDVSPRDARALNASRLMHVRMDWGVEGNGDVGNSSSVVEPPSPCSRTQGTGHGSKQQLRLVHRTPQQNFPNLTVAMTSVKTSASTLHSFFVVDAEKRDSNESDFI